MYSKHLNLDPDTIKDCILALGEPVSDRKAFMNRLMLERLDTVNKRSIDEFGQCLDELSERVNDQSSIKTIGRLVNRLSRISRKVSKNELILLKFIHRFREEDTLR